jgi:hypothetical protein
MATQMLFYEAAVPLSAARHGEMSIEQHNYSFSRNINSVPLTAVEFPVAAAEYSIVFVGEPGSLMPAAIVGVRPSENLFVDAGGAWDAKYVPGFVRRYPFVFTSPDEGQTFTLCIDEAYPGLNREGRGQRLYDAQRKPSPFTGQVLEFLQQYEMEYERTRAFCRKLEELQLLEPMQAEVSLAAGESASLGGFLAVDRDKLKAMAPARFAELAQNDELEMIYVHLQSMRNFERMRSRLEARQAG